MAGDHASGSAGADFAEHEKTYLGFLLVLKISSAVTVAVLLSLYFFLAR